MRKGRHAFVRLVCTYICSVCVCVCDCVCWVIYTYTHNNHSCCHTSMICTKRCGLCTTGSAYSLSHAMIVGQTTHVTWMSYKRLTSSMALISCSITEFLVAACATTLACCLCHTSQSLSTSRQDIQQCLPKNMLLTGDDVALTSAWQGHTRIETHHFVCGAEHSTYLVVDSTF